MKRRPDNAVAPTSGQRLPWTRVFPFLAALCASAGCTTTGFGLFGSAYSGLNVAGIDVSDAGDTVGYVVYPETSADPNDPTSAKKSMAVEFSASIDTDTDVDILYTRFHVLVDLLEKPDPAEGQWYYPYVRAGLGFESLIVDRWLIGYYESTSGLSVVGSVGLEAIWERHIAFFIQAKTSLWLGDKLALAFPSRIESHERHADATVDTALVALPLLVSEPHDPRLGAGERQHLRRNARSRRVLALLRLGGERSAAGHEQVCHA